MPGYDNINAGLAASGENIAGEGSISDYTSSAITDPGGGAFIQPQSSGLSTDEGSADSDVCKMRLCDAYRLHP